MIKRILPADLIRFKQNKQRFSMLTAYDALTAQLLEASQISCILIGDSLGNVFAGHDSTIPVTLEHMIYHCQAVSRVTSESMLIADMPFLSTQISVEQAKINAGKLIQQGGVQAVKVEVFSDSDLDSIHAILNCGIPVLAHLGLTPQSVYQLGGYKKQAKDFDSEQILISRAKTLCDLGCFSILVECIPDSLAKKLQSLLPVPVIGIGSGTHCDAQVLVTQDLLGLNSKPAPSFVKAYASLYKTAQDAIKSFDQDVKNNKQ